MRYTKHCITLATLTFFLSLAGCKNKDDQVTLAGKAPLAKIAPVSAISLGSVVNLDGSGSSDPDGDVLTYKWEIKTKPSASAAVVSNSNNAKATFSPDVTGKYVISLTVSDNVWPALTEQVELTVDDAPAQQLSGTIGSVGNTTLWKNIVQDPTKPDYYVVSDLSIRSFLTIEPGVVLHFSQNFGITFEDKSGVKAKGTSAQRIVFTGAQNAKGFWKGITLVTNDPRNEFDYVDVTYAGSEKPFFGQVANVNVLGEPGIGLSVGFLKLTNSNISYSKGSGIYVGGQGLIEGFANNIISNNNNFAITLPANQVSELDTKTKYTGSNGKNYIEIYGSTLKRTTETTWNPMDDNTRYYVTGHISLNSGLKINPGSYFEAVGTETGIGVGDGYLIAKGTKDKKIVFTGTQKTPGIWKGLGIFNKDVRNELEYIEISYGGSALFGNYAPQPGNLTLWDWPSGGRVKVSNSNITNSLGYGIVHASGTRSELILSSPDSNVYGDNAKGNIYITN